MTTKKNRPSDRIEHHLYVSLPSDPKREILYEVSKTGKATLDKSINDLRKTIPRLSYRVIEVIVPVKILPAWDKEQQDTFLNGGSV